MRRRSPIVLAAAAVVAVLSCGTDPGVLLTSTEAKALLRTIMEEFDPYYRFEDEVVDCPDGGEKAFSVGHDERHDTKGDSVIFTTDVRLSFARCQVSAGGEGYTLSGDPALTHSARDALGGGWRGHAHWTLSGTFGWERGEESGRCGVDLTLDTVFGDVWFESFEEAEYRGEACGHAAELTPPL